MLRVLSGGQAVTALLEGFGFVFLYAGLFENFAVVNGALIFHLSRRSPLPAGQEAFSVGI